MRVFAGPNGSGKSTIINAVRKTKVKGQLVDFGIYINADDIAKNLRNHTFDFSTYFVTVTFDEFKEESIQSGLIGVEFTEAQFLSCFIFNSSKVLLTDKQGIIKADERIAQIIAHFLRKKLLKEKKKLSFETVFSHKSKLDIMREAKEAGYKVYLYFVSTESPEINKFRVEARKNQGGHDVDPVKIEQRYYRSLELLFEAAQMCYQVYFIDNSEEGEQASWFAHFKLIAEKKKWDKIKKDEVPEWFKKYYSSKVAEGKTPKKNKTLATNQLVKRHLYKLSMLYVHPYFSGKDFTPELINSFYNTVIRVSKLPVKDFKYYKSNLTTENVSDMDSLVTCLSAEKSNPQRNDSRYALGFRSLWYILNENKETLTPDYLQEIIDLLQPFYDNFQYKDYLKKF